MPSLFCHYCRKQHHGTDWYYQSVVSNFRHTLWASWWSFHSSLASSFSHSSQLLFHCLPLSPFPSLLQISYLFILEHLGQFCNFAIIQKAKVSILIQISFFTWDFFLKWQVSWKIYTWCCYFLYLLFTTQPTLSGLCPFYSLTFFPAVPHRICNLNPHKGSNPGPLQWKCGVT